MGAQTSTKAHRQMAAATIQAAQRHNAPEVQPRDPSELRSNFLLKDSRLTFCVAS
jgi:hypothetical protein